MQHDGQDSPVRTRITRSPLANMNLTELDEARGIASYKPSARLKQSSALVGDVAARDYIRTQYRGRAQRIVMRRANGVPVFDQLYEVGKGEFVVAESKANEAPFGKTKRRVYIAGSPGDTRIRQIPKDVVQFSPEWFQQRLEELRRDFGAEGNRLANRLEHAWHEGKLRPLAIRAPSAGMTTEHVLIEDVSKQWNDHIGVRSTHTMPVDRRPKITTDPGRMLSAGPTDVERGLEAAEKAVPPADPHYPHTKPHMGTPRLSTAEHLGTGALKIAERGFKARSLVIGVKAWRVARTVGTVLIKCFVPLTVFDVVLEIGFALWDRHHEKEERKRREKQRALEAVFKADTDTKILQQGIQNNIVNNREVQAAFMSAWDNNMNYNGFQYARLHAMLAVETYRNFWPNEEVDSLTTYRLIALNVFATSSAHAFEVDAIGEAQEVPRTDEEKRKLLQSDSWESLAYRKFVGIKKLTYTLVPPLLTPYDIIVAKINNLFLDIVFFCAQFSNSGEAALAHFKEFNYTYPWEQQFTLALEFPHPLAASVCQFCLDYLHFSAKQLSRHPLEPQDLEGNLENPRRGWQRRFWLLLSLLEGRNAPQGKNFSFMAAQLKKLVTEEGKNHEVSTALEELYTGARAIWYDLERIERNVYNPEYSYLGPQYKG